MASASGRARSWCMRPILIVGGSPRVRLDAVRHLTVAATGRTAAALADRLAARGRPADLLLSLDAEPGAVATRYDDRPALETALRAWIVAHPDGAVVMSAAVNDYEVAAIEAVRGGARERVAPAAKLSSGADEVVVRLRPAAKLIDGLRGWGLRGPIIGFKYEAADTVEASAAALLRRVGAAAVVANSLGGEVQALVDAHGCVRLPDRDRLLAALTDRLVALTTPGAAA